MEWTERGNTVVYSLFSRSRRFGCIIRAIGGSVPVRFVVVVRRVVVIASDVVVVPHGTRR